jgi:hypothetical protein
MHALPSFRPRPAQFVLGAVDEWVKEMAEIMKDVREAGACKRPRSLLRSPRREIFFCLCSGACAATHPAPAHCAPPPRRRKARVV